MQPGLKLWFYLIEPTLFYNEDALLTLHEIVKGKIDGPCEKINSAPETESSSINDKI